MAPLFAVREGEGPLVVALHGFTQAGAAMAPLLGALSGPRSRLLVDLPGHAGSGSVSADLEKSADLVVELADGEPFDLVGYSLGGRVALHVACRAPQTLRSVVAISASPGLPDEAARAARLERDRVLAAELRATGVPEFLERWLRNPLFATLPPDRSLLELRSANTAEGLADSLTRCSLGAQRDLRGDLVGSGVPVLLLAGSRDDPYVDSSTALAARASHLRAAVVPGAGHACHLEQPRLVARLIDEHLRTR